MRMLQKRYIPFKYKISAVMVILTVSIVAFMSTIYYIYTKNAIMQQYRESQQLLEYNAKSAVKAMDHTYFALEKSLEDVMRQTTSSIIEEYNEKNRWDRIDLHTFTQRISGMDIYIIDKNYVVPHTTDEKDLQLDFKQFPDFITILQKIIKNGEFVSDRINLTVSAGELKKFSYQPTPDGKYIVEIGINMNHFDEVLSQRNLNNVFDDLITSNDTVEKITLYTSGGTTYNKKNEDGTLEVIPNERFPYFEQALKTNQVIKHIQKYKGKTLYYHYIPYLLIEGMGTNEINVIEIIFNDQILQTKLTQAKWIIGVCMIIAIILSIIFGFVTAELISKPIYRMVEGMNRVSKGEFTYRTNIHTNDEFKLLSKSFDSMIDHVRRLLEERNERAVELEEKNQEIVAQKDEINALYEETAAMNEELESLLEQNEKNYLNTVRVLANAIEAKDKYTRGHCDRVTEYAVAIAEAMDFHQGDILNLKFAAILHDVGKIGIPSAIINKQGKLNDEEWETIRKHPQIGYEILKDVEFLQESRKAIYQHHEQVDGKGYPNKLKGNQIHPLARLIGIADAYDAMTSNRPYRTAPLTEEQALAQLLQGKGTQFDHEMVDVFVSLLTQKDTKKKNKKRI